MKVTLRAPRIVLGALFLLIVGSFAASANPSLAIALFEEGNWKACRTECRRIILETPANSQILLLMAMAETRDGLDSTSAFRSIAASVDAPPETRCLASFESGRQAWKERNHEQAFDHFRTCFENTSSRDLFIRSACSLFILASNNHSLIENAPQISMQLQTCRHLWNNNIVEECDLSQTNTNSRISTIPAQWLIAFYRSQIGPAIGQRCSLFPSCSSYTIEALNNHGLAGMSIFADRAVREPDVVSKGKATLKINNFWKYADPLSDHTFWFTSREKTAGPIARPVSINVISSGIASGSERENQGKSGRDLAISLTLDQQYNQAAIEFRRLAMEKNDTTPDVIAAYYWMSAYSYWMSADYKLAMKMLDLCESVSQKLTEEVLLLRAEIELKAENNDEAQFYLDSILLSASNSDMSKFAGRRLAGLLLAKPDETDKALEILSKYSPDHDIAVKAIQNYTASNDKSPVLGGFLGAVLPGLGYAYSGEYSNALRSLLLNGLFIFAMVESADSDNWGAFTAISFFEMTWYTGSIYGGIDSAHRYNRDRLRSSVELIDGNTELQPNLHSLPAISIKFQF